MKTEKQNRRIVREVSVPTDGTGGTCDPLKETPLLSEARNAIQPHTAYYSLITLTTLYSVVTVP